MRSMTVFRMISDDGKVTVTYSKKDPKNPYQDILNIDLTYVPEGLGSSSGLRIKGLSLQKWKDKDDWFILRSSPGNGVGGIVLSRDEARHLALAILGEVAQDDLEDILHVNEHLRELDAIDAVYLGD